MKLRMLATLSLLALTTALALAQNAPMCACAAPSGPPNPNAMFVAYLPFYKGLDWVAFAPTIDFTKMTHLNLGFINPPRCTPGPCTAQNDMHFTANKLTDAGIDAIVAAAHAHGVKVMASIGGGGGDQLILQFYNAGLTDQLIASLDAYMKQHKLDGVDLDMEDPSNMGMPLQTFVTALTATFHPQGKLVSAAVARYLQGSMRGDTLKQFDFINVMVYGSYQQSLDALNYYANDRHFPKDKITLGIGFFGTGQVNGRELEEDYAKIVAAYSNAPQNDLVAGGSLDNGAAFHYGGEATVAKEVELGKQFGGVMVWELTGDAPAPHSLLQVIQKTF